VKSKCKTATVVLISPCIVIRTTEVQNGHTLGFMHVMRLFPPPKKPPFLSPYKKKSGGTRLCGCGGLYVTGFTEFDRSPKPQAGMRKGRLKIKMSFNILGTEVVPYMSCSCSLSAVRSIQYLTLSTQVYNVKCKYYT